MSVTDVFIIVLETDCQGCTDVQKMTGGDRCPVRFISNTHTHTLYVHVGQARISADEFIYNMSMYIYI